MIGKIIGAILGFLLLRNLYGVVIGTVLGHLLFDTRLRSGAVPREQLVHIQQVFFNSLFTLLGHVAKADGHISEFEIKLTEAFMVKMGLNTEHRQEAIRLFKVGAASEFDLAGQLKIFMTAAQRSPNLRQMLLVYLINLAMSDGHLDANEVNVLRDVAQHIGFSRIAFDQLLHMIGAQNSFAKDAKPHVNDLNLAYEALGVTKEHSDSDIKKAYRKLMSQYHPDKLIGQGLPDDMVKAATERSQEVQAAYEMIKKSRE
jgi:DnaJ like chaperone protein